MSEPPVIPPPLAYAPAPSAIESRPQQLAVRSLRALGFLCTISGLACGTFAAIAAVFSDGPNLKAGIGAVILEFIGLTGIVYLICAAKIRRGSRVAGIVAISIAAVQEGLALLAFVASIIGFFLSTRAAGPGASTGAAVVIGVYALAVLAFAQLLYHLFRFLHPSKTRNLKQLYETKLLRKFPWPSSINFAPAWLLLHPAINLSAMPHLHNHHLKTIVLYRVKNPPIIHKSAPSRLSLWYSRSGSSTYRFPASVKV